MRADLAAMALAVAAAPLAAAAGPYVDSRGTIHAAAPTLRATPTEPGAAAREPATAEADAQTLTDAQALAHDSPLVAYARELAETESRAQQKAQYIATANLRAVTFEMSRHPPPGDEDCAHTLGASRFAQQYARIATIQHQLGDFEAVIDASESALACQPREASHQASIASANLNLGRIDEARAAVERGYAINPEDDSIRDVRARLDFIQERWADATARFRLLVLNQGNSYFSDYARCYLWLAQRRAGVRDPDVPARPATLKEDGSPSLTYKRWPTQVLDTLRGEMSEADLVEVIRESGVSDAREWLTEALFYVGELKLAQGDTEAAQRHFASVVNLKVLNFVEYGMARAELKKMRDRDAGAATAAAGTRAR